MATETITGHFTCDNSYAVYVGTQSAVVTKVLPTTGDGITNSNATQIFQGDDVTFTANSGDYFYLIAWSDDNSVQGLIGEFTGTSTILTGDAAWEVYATGKNYGNNQAPTATEITSHIAAANAASAWKATAVGPVNSNSSLIYGGPATLKVGNVRDNAQWIWYNSGKNGNNSAFVGFNHDEFLIFRIPAWKMAEELNPVNPTPTPTPTPTPAPAPAHDCCCGCVPAQPLVCMPAPAPVSKFDISISRVRIVKNSARDGKGEIMLTGYADGASAVVPGMGSYITLFTNWGWRVMNKYVTTVAVAQDSTVSVPLMAEALLSITGGMRMGACQDLKYMDLKAGSRTEAQVLTIECIDARSNGNRENVFVLEVEFVAVEK